MTDARSSTGTPLWMRITLFVSLALNLLIIGAVAGFVLSGGPDKRMDRAARDVGTVYTRALNDDHRRALRRDFATALAERGRDRETVLHHMEATVATLRMSPFDPAAFVRSLEEQSGQRREREVLGRDVLAARIAAMSDAERAAYADRVEQGLRELQNRLRR